VTLIAGPGTPDCSHRVNRIGVESAAEMLSACQQQAKGADTFIGTAAVSDFAFKEQSKEKLKRGDAASLSVELINNPDIVATIAGMDGRPKQVIAFAAESSDHVKQAHDKLTRKGVDAIFANDVSNMGSDLAGGWWITGSHEKQIETAPKEALAQTIIEKIMELK